MLSKGDDCMKKVIVLCLALFLMTFLSACSQSQPYDPSNRGTWYDENGGKISAFEIDDLKIGMTVTEMIDLLGKANGNPYSGLMGAKYIISENEALHIALTLDGTTYTYEGDHTIISSYSIVRHTDDGYTTLKKWSVPKEQWNKAYEIRDFSNIDNYKTVETFDGYVSPWVRLLLQICVIVILFAGIIVVFLVLRRPRKRATPPEAEEQT